MLNESQTDGSFDYSSANTSNVEETDPDLIETHGVGIKITFVCIACVSLLSSLTAITAMQQSKKQPYASKFMSTGLLTFDVIFIVLSTVRKFVSDPVIDLHIQTIVTLNVLLSVSTVGLMSFERYFLILKPMRYLNSMTKMFIRKANILFWLSEGSLCIFVRYGVCYFRLRTMSVFTSPGVCNGITTTFYAFVLGTALVSSFICYLKIFQQIRCKIRPDNIASVPSTTKGIQNYRSTSLVFVYLIVIFASSIAYGLIILFIKLGKMRPATVRITLELVSICNCILDPFLYVLWFKECRLKLLQYLAVFCKQYEYKAEQMRIEVYDIVTVSSLQHKACSVNTMDKKLNS